MEAGHIVVWRWGSEVRMYRLLRYMYRLEGATEVVPKV